MAAVTVACHIYQHLSAASVNVQILSFANATMDISSLSPQEQRQFEAAMQRKQVLPCNRHAGANLL
jgi:hypothetical protein